ncbi:hypothetical protein K2X14_07730 [Acetobacter sp. TBRC 12305]|uniref:Uncharacterized protein n=1 Tax=Acetobacter garciniae TaxID=2817435 RepID=A0A939HQ34_9PROT|nr:hypothetical protein [Acetobacter garciniae]MBO1325306.1 hypothetical protein [Acetobacter garciniae]MBX0344722.1 hypothetical protein [Acetobacter garciniae]
MAKRAISPFAHLAGGVRAATDDTNEDPKDKDKTSGEDGGDGEGEEPEDDAKRGKKGKNGKTAEGDSPEDDADNGENAEGTDDDDEDDEADPKARAIRMRERGRCAAIFRSAAAGRNPAAAAELAFGTSLPRSQAVRVLRATAPAADAGQPAQADTGYTALRTRMGVEGRGALSQPAGEPENRAGARLARIANAKR